MFIIKTVTTSGDVFLKELGWPKVYGQILEAQKVANTILAYPRNAPKWLISRPMNELETKPHPFVSALNASDVLLPGFSTVDVAFAASIASVLAGLADYCGDMTRKRPYNILMTAPPGSGKSHFIKCLAKRLEIPAVLGNLSVADPTAALSFVVDEARNHKALDSTPLLFLDEVDSDPSLMPLLLPLLWDGELSTTGQVLRLGRCIIVCAVSDHKLISHASKASGRHLPKLNDFLSRCNGGILDISSINTDKRRLDRLYIAAQLTRRRFANARTMPIGLLQFLSSIRVEHEVRSIECFVDQLPISLSFASNEEEEKRSRDDLCAKFPDLLDPRSYTDGPLRFHITDAIETTRLWGKYSKHIMPLPIDKIATSETYLSRTSGNLADDIKTVQEIKTALKKYKEKG